MDSPSPYHITLVVRTGLVTGHVWIQGTDGNSTQGILVSYGESQRVWQISYIASQFNARSVIINANHDYVMDEDLISQIYRFGQMPGHSEIRDSAADCESETPSWRGIYIIGDDQFVQRTIRAMEMVEAGPSWAYDYIVTYLDYVRQQSVQRRARAGGHINVRTRTFYVYSNTYTSSVMWFASALVHEAVHARQFREYLESYGGTTPRRVTFYSTFEEQKRIEMEALDIQIRFLEEAGASRHLINSARSFIGTVWWR
jgi:hypothetical protein